MKFGSLKHHKYPIPSGGTVNLVSKEIEIASQKGQVTIPLNFVKGLYLHYLIIHIDCNTQLCNSRNPCRSKTLQISWIHDSALKVYWET